MSNKNLWTPNNNPGEIWTPNKKVPTKVDSTPRVEFPDMGGGMVPEQTFILKSQPGDHEVEPGKKIVLIVQMWKIQRGGNWCTYATTAAFGPVDMNDDDARWMAEQLRGCFNRMK